MTDEGFDPYHKWLGIPAHVRPIDHYRLLGLRRFESDHVVIENAADARMRQLRQLAGGARASNAKQLLNEIAEARIRLTDPEKKREYDQRLREPAAGPTPQDSTNPSRPSMLPPRLQFSPIEAAGRQVTKHETDSPDAVKVDTHAVKVEQPTLTVSTRRQSTRLNSHYVLGGAIGVGLIGIVLGVALLYVLVSALATGKASTESLGNSSEGQSTERSIGEVPDRTAALDSEVDQVAGARVSQTQIEIVDLLAIVNPAQDQVWGSIERTDAGSIVTGRKLSRAQIRIEPPGAYRLVAEVTRRVGTDAFVLGLVAGDQQFAVVIDGFAAQGYRSGLNLVDGHTLLQPKNTTGVAGQRLIPGQPTQIECDVDEERIRVSVDDQELVDFQLGSRPLSLRRQMIIADAPPLFVASWFTSFEIQRLELEAR